MACQAFPFFKLLLPGFLENSEAYLLFPLPSPSIFRLLSLIDHFHVSCILMFPRKKQEQQSAITSPSETGGRGANGGVGMGDSYYRLEKIQVVANT